MKLILKLVVFDSVKGLSNGLILVMMISLLLNKQQTKPWTWVPKITFYILSDDGEDIDGVPTEAVEITCFHMVMLDHLSLFYLHIYLTCVIMIMLHCSFHTGDCLISSVTMHKLVFFFFFSLSLFENTSKFSQLKTYCMVGVLSSWSAELANMHSFSASDHDCCFLSGFRMVLITWSIPRLIHFFLLLSRYFHLGSRVLC